MAINRSWLKVVCSLRRSIYCGFFWAMSTTAIAADGISVSVWADTADSVHSVSFEGKQLKLTTGALGLRVSHQAPVFGELYLDGGVGYAPDRKASFIGASLTGDANLRVLGLGFRRQMALPNSLRYAIAVEGRHLEQEMWGDFSGRFGRFESTADMSATLKTSDLELAFIRLRKRSQLVLGFGLRYWDVDAQGQGKLGESIRINTEAEFAGTSPLLTAMAIFPMFQRDLTLRYEWSQVPADDSVGINRLTVRWQLR